MVRVLPDLTFFYYTEGTLFFSDNCTSLEETVLVVVDLISQVLQSQ